MGRSFLHHNPAIASAVLRIFLRAIRTTLREASSTEATHLTSSDWGELQHTVRHRVLRYFHRHGLLEPYLPDPVEHAAHRSGGCSVPLGTLRGLDPGAIRSLCEFPEHDADHHPG